MSESLTQDTEQGSQPMPPQHTDQIMRPVEDEFVGLDRLVSDHEKQINSFILWARERTWYMFKPEHSHYDWWAFPITKPSNTYGHQYAVPLDVIEKLKANADFLARFEIGVTLMLASWGWDLRAGEWLAEPAEDQVWEGYSVRLRKLGNSVLVLGDHELKKAVNQFALALKAEYPHTFMAPLPYNLG